MNVHSLAWFNNGTLQILKRVFYFIFFLRWVDANGGMVKTNGNQGWWSWGGSVFINCTLG